MKNTDNTNTVLPILIATNSFLRKKTRIVQPEDISEIRKVLPTMFETMYQASGIGLAAPQVGIGLRFFIVDLMKDDVSDPMVFINPEIFEKSDEQSGYREGCLSFPEQFADVIRPEKIKVKYMDLEGKINEIEADGLLARCIQHETDHLDGILFVDHLSSLKKNIIMRKIIKEQKREH